jgi:hypothetical protein
MPDDQSHPVATRADSEFTLTIDEALTKDVSPMGIDR